MHTSFPVSKLVDEEPTFLLDEHSINYVMFGPSILHPPSVPLSSGNKHTHALLTPDNEIDVLASRVAHIVDSRAVVEACVSRCDGPQNQCCPPNLGAEGKGAWVT